MATLAQRQLFSAINIGSPWRGLNVMPDASTFSAVVSNNLAAAMFLFAIFSETTGAALEGAVANTVSSHGSPVSPKGLNAEPHVTPTYGHDPSITTFTIPMKGRGF